jgi:RNA polymerase-binding protein DksA
MNDKASHAPARQRLLALRAQLKGDIRDTIDEVLEKGAGGDELSDVPTHAADNDSEGLDRELGIEANREQMLDAIDHALQRLDDGLYGQCETCGSEIAANRMQALPFATRCISCAREDEQE